MVAIVEVIVIVKITIVVVIPIFQNPIEAASPPNKSSLSFLGHT